MKAVKLNAQIDALLTQLSQQRKESGHLNATKQDIVAELIINQYKKEVAKK